MNDIRDIVHDGVAPGKAAASLSILDSDRGGYTTWHKRKVAEIAAPLKAGAQARTIRIHELLHANHSTPTKSRKYPALANDAIEDVRVQAVYWPLTMPRRANRDCRATALQEIHNLPSMAMLGRADDWNKSLLVALRATAILHRVGHVSRKATKDRFRLNDKIAAAFGPIIAEKLDEILYRALRAKRSVKALKDFTALMRLDDEAGNNFGDCSGRQSGHGSNGKATDQPMRIVKLSMPEACDSKTRRTALARSGSRLNRARLARAVATGSFQPVGRSSTVKTRVASLTGASPQFSAVILRCHIQST